MQEALSFFNTFLLVFAAIGLVVACFTIYNTFQIIVTQRSREMALLRSFGATRRQVLVAQLLEAVIVGRLSPPSSAWSPAWSSPACSRRCCSAFGIDIPAGGTVFAARTAVVALVVGTVVTVVSAVFPSLRASRVPPLAALRDVAVDRSGQSRPRLVAGAVLTVLGVGRLRGRAGRVGHRLGRARRAADVHRRVHARTADRPAVSTRASARRCRRSPASPVAGPGERAAQPEAHRPHRRRADGRRRPGRRDHGHRGVAEGLDPRRLRASSSPATTS